MDLLADADIGPNPEANEVLMRPTRVLEGWAPPSNAPNAVGWVSSSDPTTITLKPSAWSRRFDIGVGVPGPWTYRGLANAVTKYSDLFPALMFHEARHSWQYLLSRNGFTDADGDFLVQNPPVSSPEIADAPYPTNPDFSFLGDAGGSGSNDLVLQPAMRRESVEHNADRFAMRQLGGLLTCASAYCLAAAVDSANGAMVVTGTYQGEGSAEQGQQKLNGRLVKIETASTCGSTSWTPLPNNFTNCFGTGRPCATDSEGRLTIPSLPGGQSYRFTLINPAECSAQEVSTCVAIP